MLVLSVAAPQLFPDWPLLTSARLSGYPPAGLGAVRPSFEITDAGPGAAHPISKPHSYLTRQAKSESFRGAGRGGPAMPIPTERIIAAEFPRWIGSAPPSA